MRGAAKRIKAVDRPAERDVDSPVDRDVAPILRWGEKPRGGRAKILTITRMHIRTRPKPMMFAFAIFVRIQRSKDTMATTADIKNGLCIRLNGKLMSIVEFQHVKPGKGPAFVRTKLKNLETGKVLDHTFPAGHSIEPVRIENRPYQYLYEEGNGYHFMHTETFEQVFIEKHLLDKPEFLKEEMVVTIVFNADDETPLTVELPQFIEVEVTYTEPGIKGDTATNTMKPATIDTGAEVRVPLFIDIGDRIKVDTRTGEYNERVKA